MPTMHNVDDVILHSVFLVLTKRERGEISANCICCRIPSSVASHLVLSSRETTPLLPFDRYLQCMILTHRNVCQFMYNYVCICGLLWGLNCWRQIDDYTPSSDTLSISLFRVG